MHLLFSHTLTAEQIADAKECLGISEFVTLPEELQRLWSQVPPELESLQEYLSPLQDYLKIHLVRGDYVLISGDFGATYMMVDFCKDIGAIPLYATTKRETREFEDIEGRVVRQSLFRHIRFRRY